MMNRTHIASTPSSQLNALRFQGILVSENYSQLTSMLERNISAEHALFFAEPVQDTEGKTIDWYSNVPGPIVPLVSLPSEQQIQARAAIQDMASRINEYADTLKAEGQGPKFLRGNILSLALNYPGEEYIYMSGNQPVLTGWGYGPATMGMEPEPLIRLGAAAPVFAGAGTVSTGLPPVEEPATAEKKKGGILRLLMAFLLGLLLLLGFYLLLMLLLGPAGCPFLKDAPLPPGCSASIQPQEDGENSAEAPADNDKDEPSSDLVTALTAEKEKEESLRGQLESLRRQVLERAQQCVRTPPPDPKPEPEEKPTPAPEPEPQPEVEVETEPQEPPSLAELMPTTPEPAPEPKAEPKPKPKPEAKPQPKPEPKPKEEPKKPPQPKTNELVIPKDAEKNNDLSFLEGCWTNATTLKDGKTGKPIRSTYCFDKNGRGTRTEQGIGHDLQCRSSASARFVSGRLRISATEAACTSRGRSRGRYPKEAIVCDRTVDGRANCYESQNDRWKARLQRVR